MTLTYKIKNPVKKILLFILDCVLYLVIHQKRNQPVNLNRILVIRMDNLGDIFLTRPLLKSLRDAFPQAVLDVLIESEARNVIHFDSFINQVLIRTKETPKKLRKHYDLIIEPKGRLDYAWLTWRLKPRFSIGFGDAGGGAFFNVSLTQLNQHPIEKNQLICKILTINYDPDIPPLKIPESIREKVSAYCQYIVICPFSSRTEKDWPVEKTLALAQTLQSNGSRVVLSVEERKRLMMPQQGSSPIPVLSFTSGQLTEWMALLSVAKAVIAPDSAAIHVSAALGIPSLALYGHEDPEIWHPYSTEKHRFIKVTDNVRDIQEDNVISILKELKVL